jgi:hypothetical protein
VQSVRNEQELNSNLKMIGKGVFALGKAAERAVDLAALYLENRYNIKEGEKR